MSRVVNIEAATLPELEKAGGLLLRMEFDEDGELINNGLTCYTLARMPDDRVVWSMLGFSPSLRDDAPAPLLMWERPNPSCFYDELTTLTLAGEFKPHSRQHFEVLVRPGKELLEDLKLQEFLHRLEPENRSYDGTLKKGP